MKNEVFFMLLNFGASPCPSFMFFNWSWSMIFRSHLPWSMMQFSLPAALESVHRTVAPPPARWCSASPGPWHSTGFKKKCWWPFHTPVWHSQPEISTWPPKGHFKGLPTPLLNFRFWLTQAWFLFGGLWPRIVLAMPRHEAVACIINLVVILNAALSHQRGVAL